MNDNKSNPTFLFKKLHRRAMECGLTQEHFSGLESLQHMKTLSTDSSICERILFYTLSIIIFITCVFLCLFISYHADWPLSQEQIVSSWFWVYDVDMDTSSCALEIPDGLVEQFRPPVDCSMCRNISSVEQITQVSQEDFLKKYAYTGKPVVILDAAQNWSAPNFFSFNFFSKLYANDSPVLENLDSSCQFFPYKTNFNNLREVLEMDRKRAYMLDGSEPWYIGWSNCDFEAADVLRKHYSRPYFLPDDSESSKTDWIFMGSPGYGAHMHVDNVGNPSWQAQITGHKRWTLEPPPECYYECPPTFSVVLEPGHIIVVDTNRWYHSTLNVGDDISICIGSEFD